MGDHQARVYIVDDDDAMRDSLRFMFTGTGLQVETYASAEEFLAAYSPDACGCIILDLQMPGMGGMALHEKLRAAGSHLPVIFLTGHGDMLTAVEEMKVGAFDFISKPVNRNTLLQRVHEAIKMNMRRQQDDQEKLDIQKRLAKLTQRERQILDEVAAGRASKQIAFALGLSPKTVVNHRANITKKMGAINTADLVQKLGRGGRPAPPQSGH